MASNSGLAAERADVSCVLCDFHLLDLLTEGSTVSVGREESAQVLLSYLLAIAGCRLLIASEAERYFEWCAAQIAPFVPKMVPVGSHLSRRSRASICRRGVLLLGLLNVPSTVLAGNSDLLGAFGHLGCGLAVMNKSLMFFVAGPSALISVFLDSISRDLF